MLDLTAATEVGGVRFDGVDLFLAEPHTSIDSSKDEIGAARRQDRGEGPGGRLGRRAGLAAGRRRLGHGRRETERKRFVTMVRQGLRHRPPADASSASALGRGAHRFRHRRRRLGEDPPANTKLIAETFRRRLRRRREHGERLAAEGEICWGGMHSWKGDGRSARSGRAGRRPSASRPTWPIRCSTRSATTRPRRASCRKASTGRIATVLDQALKTLTDALRPWTIDFHVAQNDATVNGTGSHDKTGRHCLVNDPNGKLDVVHDAGYWLRDAAGAVHASRSGTSAGTAVCSRTR